MPIFSRRLRQNEAALKRRSGIDERHPWWALSRYYSWAQKREPRIVSKYFGGPGAFAIDEGAEYVPIQGYAWFALPSLVSRVKLRAPERLIRHLKAYLTLLNSETFGRLLRVYSPHAVAGGQSNLSRRFVKQVPMPAIRTPGDEQLIADLVSLADEPDRLSRSWLASVEELTPLVWGRELVIALREMDDA
jgi:adenine-specific DNA-methyltransferase